MIDSSVSYCIQVSQELNKFSKLGDLLHGSIFGVTDSPLNVF